MKNNAIAIIPARGGSKRIPRKNIKNFLGYPIIYYSINAALKSDLFDEVMVSTEDKEIAGVSKKFGAEVPFLRSRETSDNRVSLKDVIFEILNIYHQKGINFDYICCILPTAPLLTVENLKKTFQLLKEKNSDAVIPVIKYSYPIQRALKIENGLLKMVLPRNLHVNSQNLVPSYHDAGQFYWLKVKSFLKQKEFFMEKTLPFEISELEAHDIDNKEDWKIAEFKYNAR